MCRTPLDIYDYRPQAMNAYLQNYGWHFSQKACEFAVSMLYKKNPTTGKEEKVQPMSKEEVDKICAKYNVKLENNQLYDYVYIANKIKADYWQSSIVDEQHFALHIKDDIDDIDTPVRLGCHGLLCCQRIRHGAYNGQTCMDRM